MFYGWEKVEMTDYEFNVYLRVRNAIDNYFHCGRTVEWRAPSGVCVAVVVYDNGPSPDRDIYLPPKAKEQTT